MSIADAAPNTSQQVSYLFFGFIEPLFFQEIFKISLARKSWNELKANSIKMVRKRPKAHYRNELTNAQHKGPVHKVVRRPLNPVVIVVPADQTVKFKGSLQKKKNKNLKSTFTLRQYTKKLSIRT